MTLEKGAMIFHMLRWEVGDKAFLNILKGALSQYTDSSIRTADFEKVAEAQSQQQLTPFFAQWIDGTGAPQFTDKYAVYRLGNNKGFRTIGEIDQDLDLFRMPVELRIETDGKTEIQKVDVVGTDIAVCGGHLRPARAASASIPATGCSRPRPTCRCASPS